MIDFPKNIVDFKEAHVFHENGQIVIRESEKLYQEKIKNIYSPESGFQEAGLGTKILEYGCGTGRQLEILPFEKEDYFGYGTANMIDKAQSKFPEHKFIDSIGEESFDIIISNLTLNQVKNKEEFQSTLEDLCIRGNNVIVRFWYSDGDDYAKEVDIFGHKYIEFFPSIATLEEMLPKISHDYSLAYYSNEKPYPCAVIEINMLTDEEVNKALDPDYIKRLEAVEAKKPFEELELEEELPF